MANLLHMDPLNELSAYREAIRQLMDTGCIGAQDFFACGSGISAGSSGCDRYG